MTTSTMIKKAFVAVALVLAATSGAVAEQIVNITNCADTQCSTSCESYQVLTNTCYLDLNTGMGVDFVCATNASSLCFLSYVFTDSNCTQSNLIASTSYSCDSCDGTNLVTCNNYENNIVQWTGCQNCTTNCTARTRIPTGSCVPNPQDPGTFVQIHGFRPCEALVTKNVYGNPTGFDGLACTGTPYQVGIPSTFCETTQKQGSMLTAGWKRQAGPSSVQMTCSDVRA